MAIKRHNFLSRAKPDRMTRDVTVHFAPHVNGKTRFYRLDTHGRVVVVPCEKITPCNVRAKKKAHNAKHTGAYLKTVRLLAGHND
jgi:hypothetical protein